MSDQHTAIEYLRSKVMSASPEEIRLMLLDGALRFARIAEYGLEQGDHEKIYDGFTQCRNIILELTTTIEGGPDPELSEKVKAIFVFIYGELVKSSFDKDLPRLRKTIELIEFERETWAQYLEQRKVYLAQNGGGSPTVTKGNKFQADELPGIVAVRDGAEVGLLTYNINGDECEIVTHNSMAGHGGIGSCLLTGVRNKAREQGCKRLWLITTNDNTSAMRFYQRRDFEIVALHRDAISEARTLKPEIPDVGLDGIAIRHEIEMEYML